MTISFGKTIRVLREASDIRLSDLAESAKISSSMMSLIESGQRAPSVEVIGRIARALNVPADLLVGAALGQEDTSRLSGTRAAKLSRTIKKLVEIENRLREQIESDDK